MPRSGGPQRAPGLGRLLEGGKRILPEENVALGDRGSEQEVQQTCAGQGFRACAGPRAFCLGHRCWGVGDDKEDLPGRSDGWAETERNVPMRKCWRRPSGSDRELPKVGFAVLRSEEILLEARIYVHGKWRTSTSGRILALLPQGINPSPPLKSLPVLCPSPSYGPFSPRPSPGPGVGRLSYPATAARSQLRPPSHARSPRRVLEDPCAQAREVPEE
ncbi:unnamed protein product [Rangifer tarandus platyrhynchus]|uniref:Uncharacterized protein n=2 Tax=Rangifer tarandus platyrhynchus TaxID=3082113 RepID=A0ABN8XXW9_RANTA|nr:unnamed protein product [Rangifer tarandus platyrhynchus]